METQKTKTISVLLTEHTDSLARLYRRLTGYTYTHAAIGIEDYGDKFFSFGIKKGFRLERPGAYARLSHVGEYCQLYHLKVTEEVYAAVKERIDEVNNNREQYYFSKLSAILCFLGISHRFDKGYFCSGFIADVLSTVGGVQLSKKPSLFQPNDFANEPQFTLYFQGALKEVPKLC